MKTTVNRMMVMATMSRLQAMRRYLGDGLGEGEHLLQVVTGTPTSVKIETGVGEDGTAEYEVAIVDLDDPEADIPLESVVDHVERRTGAVSDHLVPSMSEQEYEALKNSIAAHGVMNPILVDDKGNVIEGRQRQRACRELRINCPTTVIGRLALQEKRQLALELNLCRRQVGLPAKREIAQTLLRRTPWLSDRSIGLQAGLDHKTVGAMRITLRAGGEIPHLSNRTGKDGKRYPTITVHQPKDVERAKRALQILSATAANKAMELRCAERKARERLMAADREKAAVIPTSGDAIRIVQEDFRNLAIEEKTSGLVITDPPYPKQFLPLWDALGMFAARVLRPGGMLVTYTSPYYLDQVIASLGKHLTYYWQLVLLHDHGGGEMVYPRKLRTWYKPILCFSKGEPLRHRCINDVLHGHGKEKDLHDWQQSLLDAVHLIEHFSKPGDLIVDPFGGSFTAAEAVLRVGGGRRFLGCDVDRACVVLGQKRIATVRKEMGVSPLP